MEDKERINQFAHKYLSLYSDEKTHERDVEIGFPEECFALGFKMDSGESFIEKYGENAIRNPEGLEKTVDRIDSIEILGSAVFSKWRDITHWLQTNLTSDENRKWFIIAFKRLIELTE